VQVKSPRVFTPALALARKTLGSVRRAVTSYRLGRLLAPALAFLCIAGLDLVAGIRSWPLVIIGLLDEPAHLLTAWLGLSAVAVRRRRLWPYALLGAVLIDLDHVPYYLWGALDSGAGRPVSHSLVTVLALLTVAAADRRARLPAAGLAVGVLLHFARDIATGPGIPLLWPVRPESESVPYWAYLAGLTGCAVLSTARTCRRASAPH
jgi:inner membrane protein